jgi:hypothetical protein
MKQEPDLHSILPVDYAGAESAALWDLAAVKCRNGHKLKFDNETVNKMPTTFSIIPELASGPTPAALRGRHSIACLT